MKEMKLEDILPIRALEQQVWSMFDILRGETRSSEGYHVILFLLSLYRDGFISKKNTVNHSEVHDEIISRLRESDENTSGQYLEIYKSFASILNNLGKSSLEALFNALNNLDQNVLDENFASIFDDVLYRIALSRGKMSEGYIQPAELTNFICSLVDLPEESNIFNPFAGLASFAVGFDGGQGYLGQEMNRSTWAIGALRIMAHKRPGLSRYQCDDSILSWPDESEKFDLIVANPPYGLRLSHQQKDVQSDIRTIEEFLIKKGVQSLNEKGKLIAVLPLGFLFRGGNEQRLREDLINKDLLDTIISLPGGLLQHTGLALAILVINKNKEWPGEVRFIDAKDYVTTKGPRERILKYYALNGVVHGRNKIADVVRMVPNEKIRELDYNLHVPRYFKKQIEGVKLRDILENVSARRTEHIEGGKIIRIRDLKDDKFDYKLDLSSVEDAEELTRSLIRQIDETCLLLATRWKTLKPTLFEYSGTPIFLSMDILAFRVNEDKVDSAYLINELHADYVEEQLVSYRLGGSIPMLKREDLLNVVVKVPSLDDQKHSIEIQRAKVQGISELSERIKRLQKERNDLAHGIAVNQFNEFASLKHTLGRPRQNILDWTDNLLHFLESNKSEFDSLNNAFSKFYEKDIQAVLKEIKHDVNFMTEVLEKGENGFVVEEYEKTLIPLAELNKMINGISVTGFKFKPKKNLLKGEQLKEKGIYGNKILFRILIDNLLTNADKYGFDKKENANEVIIELEELDDFVSMEVRNNGKSFPKNFDREKFITKYSTADVKVGTGLGGYDIHRIATEFNNPEWELSLDNDPIYPVKFRFQFPIKLID
jgi:type I restriction enzyme M protein